MQKGIVAPLHEKSVIGSVSHFTKILKRPNFISPFIYKIHVCFYTKRDTRSALFRAMRVSLIFYPIRMRLRPRSAEPAAHTPRQGRRPPMHLPRSAGRTAHRHGPGIGCPETRWCRLLPVNERHSCPHRTGNRSPYPAAATTAASGSVLLRGRSRKTSRTAAARTTAAKRRFAFQLRRFAPFAGSGCLRMLMQRSRWQQHRQCGQRR